MGMFDTIKCRYKLPLPSYMGELNEFHFANLQCQTKDLDGAMDFFEINESGDLFIERYDGEWIGGDVKGESISKRIGYFKRTRQWLESYPHNGEVHFYDSVVNESFKNDYHVEYKATFSNGKLSEIRLFKFEIEDNSSRKSRQQIWGSLGDLNDNFRKTLFYKLIYKHYLTTIRIISRCLNRVGQFLSNGWYLETRLDFVGQYFWKKSGVKAMQERLRKE